MRVLSVIQNAHPPIIICPFCKESLSISAQVKQCEECLAPHHVECWKEYGRCTVFGCTGRRSMERWNFRLIIPSLVLMAGVQFHLAAVALSPLFVPALLMLIIEIIDFGNKLVDRGIFSRALRKEAVRSFFYLLIHEFLFANGQRRDFRFYRAL